MAACLGRPCDTQQHCWCLSGWEEAWRPVSASEWGISGHLEPPAAPSHTINTEQQYTDQMTTTAQPQWPPHEDSTGEHYFTRLEPYHASGDALQLACCAHFGLLFELIVHRRSLAGCHQTDKVDFPSWTSHFVAVS